MKTYIISDGMKNAVNRKDITAIRSRFFTLLVRNPSGNEIKAYIDYCLKNGVQRSVLFDEHKNEPFKINKTEWNTDYWNKLVSSVQTNFSEEKLNHIIQVANHLFKEEDEAKKKSEVYFGEYGRKQSNGKGTSQKNSKDVLVVASIIGAVAVLVIILFSWRK